MNILLKNLSGGSSLGSTNYTGSDCTGSSGSKNRTLDVSSGTPNIVVLERQVLHPTSDYTLSGSVITFLVKVYNTMRITVWK